MNNYFEGYYYKHQKNNDTLCFIVGRSKSEEFIQILTNDAVYQVPFIGNNQFSKQGVKLDIHSENVTLTGEISYGELAPIKYDIMGPFARLPMECRHGIISMRHTLFGEVVLNGKTIDFSGGLGYIEMDAGRSFPKSYIWVQSNDFKEPCSVFASVATIPFLFFHFVGTIALVLYEGREYRFATYLGAKVLACTENQIVLKQGKQQLEIWLRPDAGLKLAAPDKGEMSRTILENPSCFANFKFYLEDKLVFDFNSDPTSFEYEY